MKKILIVSATPKTNFTLAKNLNTLLKEFDVKSHLISLEDYLFPIFTEKIFKNEKDKYFNKITELTNLFVENHGIIICAPEYNGSTPPILTNAIAWISMTTEYWRDAFNNKVALIGTSSGGPGNKFLLSLRMQFEHLGAVVMPRTISVNNSKPLNIESTNSILKQFINIL